MSAALDAYNRLLEAQRNPIDPDTLDKWKAEREREAENAKIRRRLPKVA